MRIVSHKIRILAYTVLVEWIMFGGWYLISDNGMRALVRLKRECAQIESQTRAVQADVARLRRECDEWRTCPFYVERYAREKLSMSYPGDEILLV